MNEAERDEMKERALWSYRANPPAIEEGKTRRVISFDQWWSELMGMPAEVEPPEISDEEIEWALKQGRIGFTPPGM